MDWAADSTLIAGLDDREQKEEFHFFDADSMRWFMMDSLWQTLKENFNRDIYYTMNGVKGDGDNNDPHFSYTDEEYGLTIY